MLIAAPKQRPEFERTRRDLYEMLKYNNPHVKINFFITKGCNCDFPALEEFYNKLKKDYKHVHVEWFKSDVPEEERDYTFSFIPDMYLAIDHLYKRCDWLTPMKLKKHYIINYHFTELAKYIYNTTKTDWFIYLEDDMTFKKDMLKRLLEYGTTGDFDNYCFEKIAPYSFSKIPTPPVVSYDKRQWGHYGLMRTRRQMSKYFRMMKFGRYYESGDTLTGDVCKSYRLNYFIMNLARHFGEDKRIPQ